MLWPKRLLRVALKGLIKNRMRSLLTTLGVIIGVASVIVMVGIGAGAQADIETQISSLGTNMLMAFPGASRHGGVSRGAGSYNKMTLDDAEAIRERAEYISAVSGVVRSGAQVIGGTGDWSTGVMGVSPEYLEIRAWGLEEGKFFDERDIRSRAKVAVVGATIVDELFPNEDPIGQKIRINKTPFRIVGVLEEKGASGFGRDEDDTILVPVTTGLYRLSGGKYINMIFVSARSLEDSEAAEEELREILRQEHRLNPGEEDDFRIHSQAEFIEMATETQEVMTLLLGAVAAVSLIVGGIGIMNIMLVSVTERTREIGIRLAVGARSSDILVQFLTESVVLSLLGGTIGVLLAYILTTVLNDAVGMTTIIQPGVVAIAFGFAAAIGVFFGYYPARKAAMLNPIDALRYE
ncbi:MAG: FtsX-like permease family protein [Candidatus Eisenbacteria bacterium]|nr:FtsX-like permease family protein [Candidatus Eisenbacteria bacterium]